MNITRFKTAIAITLFVSTASIAQKEYKPINSREIIREGIKLHDDDKYAEAIEKFEKIQRNDSSFALASVELINTYIAFKKDSLAIVLCDELLKHSDEYTPNVLLLKANALDNLKKTAEAEEIYKKGAAAYPLNNLFVFELGVSKFKQDKYFEAYQYFVQSIKINPFHPGSHYQMGNLYQKQGKIAPAMLAWQFYLICDSKSQRAGKVVNALEALARLELGESSTIEIPELKNDNDFSEIESVLRSKIALSEKYKSKTDLTFDVVKQMQLLCENIGKYQDVTGFFNSFYGKFFTNLWSTKQFEPYIYYSFSGLNNEKVNKWVAKNEKELSEYKIATYNYICTKEALYDEVLNGTKKVVPHWASYTKITAAGEKNAKQENTGYWNYYYDNGIKKSEGSFIEDKKDGIWKFYFLNGTIKSEITYNKGVELHYRDYYENTNPKSEFSLVNNLIEGKVEAYYNNGKKAADYDYVNNKINGTEVKYYRNGNKRYSITNKEGKLDGEVLETYDNGKIQQKGKFVNGKREGQTTFYFNNLKNSIKSEGTYVNGEAVGVWKSYHQNGKISEEGSYNKEGLKEGLWKNYYPSGILSQEEFFENGKNNGLLKNYTTEGKPWEEFMYKKNKITDIKSYKENGEILGEHKLSGKSNILNLYYPNGVKRREGLYEDGQTEGVWKSYNAYGVLTSEETYKDGILEGAYTSYYTNGQKKTESYYKAGKENTYFKMYHQNGNLKREGYVQNGELVGTWKYYFKDGATEEIKYFNELGELQGWYENYDVKGRKSSEDYYQLTCITKIIYFDTLGNVKQNINMPGGTGKIDKKFANGKSSFVIEYVNDYPQGKSYGYYLDGSTQSIREYENGKTIGVQKTYDEFGKLNSERPYFNGLMNGTEIKYFYDGKINTEYTYVDDELDGPAKVYYPSGKLFRKMEYVNGDSQGESFAYDELGELIYIRKYENDLLIGYSYFDAKGQLLPYKKIENGNSKIVCYFPNGKKSIEVNYTNGELNGVRTTYCSNGNVVEVESFLYNQSHGPTKSYYPNGKIKTEENYYYGSNQGVFKDYYESGKLRKESYYVNGVEHGVTKYYNEAGVLIKSITYYDGLPMTSK